MVRSPPTWRILGRPSSQRVGGAPGGAHALVVHDHVSGPSSGPRADVGDAGHLHLQQLACLGARGPQQQLDSRVDHRGRTSRRSWHDRVRARPLAQVEPEVAPPGVSEHELSVPLRAAADPDLGAVRTAPGRPGLGADLLNARAHRGRADAELGGQPARLIGIGSEGGGQSAFQSRYFTFAPDTPLKDMGACTIEATSSVV